LEILDTAGVEQFTAIRELYIKNGEGFILVYSVTNEASLHELAELREQVVRIKDNAHVPIVLVANKCDLDQKRAVSAAKGVMVADNWGKVPFYETSAKYRSNVDEVFVDLVRQIMRRDSALGTSHTRFNSSLSASIEEPVEPPPKLLRSKKSSKKISVANSSFSLKHRPKVTTNHQRKERECVIM
jgi:Ras-related protein Rap-1B